jgi:hypothetical protein
MGVPPPAGGIGRMASTAAIAKPYVATSIQ